MGDLATRLANRRQFEQPQGQMADYTIGANADLTITPTGWRPRSLGVGNLAPYFIHILDAPPAFQWIFPNVTAATVPLRDTDRVRITTKDTPPNQAPFTGSTTILADLTAFELALPPSPGVPVPAGSSNKGTAFPSLSRAVGTYQFILPPQVAAKGMIIYLGTGAGTGNVVISINLRDNITGTSTLIGASAAISANSGTVFYAYPGVTVGANSAFSAIVGQTPMIQAVVAVGPLLFQVVYELVP